MLVREQISDTYRTGAVADNCQGEVMVHDWGQALSYSVEVKHFYLIHGFPGTPASCDYYGIAIQYLAS